MRPKSQFEIRLTMKKFNDSPQNRDHSIVCHISLLSAFAKTRYPAVCICTDRVHPTSLIISFLVINSRATGSTLVNHGNGQIEKLCIELFVYFGATQSRIVAVERVPLFPGSCLGVLSTPRQPQPQYHSIESVRRIF
jgi:hypothetical protein